MGLVSGLVVDSCFLFKSCRSMVFRSSISQSGWKVDGIQRHGRMLSTAKIGGLVFNNGGKCCVLRNHFCENAWWELIVLKVYFTIYVNLDLIVVGKWSVSDGSF
jgi:hypothetical protein